ncbi:helix-turn-helix domain-containing protein [Mucilaginibacter pedocola]|uniref:HTH cro/C1-type domain-containing protein n=1 Tax=Mucilaginibacter pedocola TaxID=1792845 RepID=A0A1S9PHG1_9SPHI|nr:hypothetical protein BC343_25600 [Mucilaginibacter pedocola]
MPYNGYTIAAAIRQRRLKVNYSQEYVAEQLGISQNAYSKFEMGQCNITLIRALHVCEILGIDLAELLRPVLKVA